MSEVLIASIALHHPADALRAMEQRHETHPLAGEGKNEWLKKFREIERIREQAIQPGLFFDFSGMHLQLSIILISGVLIVERSTLHVSDVAVAIVGALLSMDGLLIFMPIPWIG